MCARDTVERDIYFGNCISSNKNREKSVHYKSAKVMVLEDRGIQSQAKTGGEDGNRKSIAFNRESIPDSSLGPVKTQ